MSNLYTKEYIQKINDLKNFFEEQNHDSELFFIAFVAWCEDITTDYHLRRKTPTSRKAWDERSES